MVGGEEATNLEPLLPALAVWLLDNQGTEFGLASDVLQELAVTEAYRL